MLVHRWMTLPPMRAIQAFEAIARCGSVAAAAEELGVSAGAISQQLRKIEADLERAPVPSRRPRAEAHLVGTCVLSEGARGIRSAETRAAVAHSLAHAALHRAERVAFACDLVTSVSAELARDSHRRQREPARHRQGVGSSGRRHRLPSLLWQRRAQVRSLRRAVRRCGGAGVLAGLPATTSGTHRSRHRRRATHRHRVGRAPSLTTVVGGLGLVGRIWVARSPRAILRSRSRMPPSMPRYRAAASCSDRSR